MLACHTTSPPVPSCHVDEDLVLSLAASIETFGWDDSKPCMLTNHGGETVVIDGHARLAALELLDIVPQEGLHFRVTSASIEEVIAERLRANLCRRHLSTSQRAMFAADVIESPMGADLHWDALGEVNSEPRSQDLASASWSVVDGAWQHLSADLHSPDEAGVEVQSADLHSDADASADLHSAPSAMLHSWLAKRRNADDLADLLKISRRIVFDALRVLREAPNLAERVRAGELSVGRALKLVKEAAGEIEPPDHIRRNLRCDPEHAELLDWLTAEAKTQGLSFSEALVALAGAYQVWRERYPTLKAAHLRHFDLTSPAANDTPAQGHLDAPLKGPILAPVAQPATSEGTSNQSSSFDSGDVPLVPGTVSQAPGARPGTQTLSQPPEIVEPTLAPRARARAFQPSNQPPNKNIGMDGFYKPPSQSRVPLSTERVRACEAANGREGGDQATRQVEAGSNTLPETQQQVAALVQGIGASLSMDTTEAPNRGIREPHRAFSKATGTDPTIASTPTIQAVTERAPLPKLPPIGEPLVVDVPPTIEEVDTKTLRELVRAYNAAVGAWRERHPTAPVRPHHARERIGQTIEDLLRAAWCDNPCVDTWKAAFNDLVEMSPGAVRDARLQNLSRLLQPTKNDPDGGIILWKLQEWRGWDPDATGIQTKPAKRQETWRLPANDTVARPAGNPRPLHPSEQTDVVDTAPATPAPKPTSQPATKNLRPPSLHTTRPSKPERDDSQGTDKYPTTIKEQIAYDLKYGAGGGGLRRPKTRPASQGEDGLATVVRAPHADATSTPSPRTGMRSETLPDNRPLTTANTDAPKALPTTSSFLSNHEDAPAQTPSQTSPSASKPVYLENNAVTEELPTLDELRWLDKAEINAWTQRLAKTQGRYKSTDLNADIQACINAWRQGGADAGHTLFANDFDRIALLGRLQFVASLDDLLAGVRLAGQRNVPITDATRTRLHITLWANAARTNQDSTP